jgi:uncharacterized protein DUF6069
MPGYQDDPLSAGGPAESPSARPLNVGRLWAGGVATAVVAALIALVGVLILRAVLRLAVYAPPEAGTLGGSATTMLCLSAVVAALAATGLAHLLLTTTPRPLTYLSWIIGLATAVAVVVPLVSGASIVLAFAQAAIHLVIGTTIGSLVITAARASRPPYPNRRFVAP